MLCFLLPEYSTYPKSSAFFIAKTITYALLYCFAKTCQMLLAFFFSKSCNWRINEAIARKHSTSYKIRKFGLASTDKKVYAAIALLIIIKKASSEASVSLIWIEFKLCPI